MKAIVCNGFGRIRDLVVTQMPAPRPGPNQVLIDVAAAGVNFLDTLMVQGTYQVRPPAPFAPGCEISGVVSDVGAGVSDIVPGHRVMAFTGCGGFAEQVVADRACVYPIPDDMSHVTAAGFLITYGTAHHALCRLGAAVRGETALVLGAAGGVGLAAVEIGSRIGMTIIAAASTDEKLQLARDHGAAHLIDYSRDDLRGRMRELTAGMGVEVVLDPVGGACSESALRGLKFMGRYLVVGFAAGEIPRFPLNVVLLRAASVIGVAWGTYAQSYPAQTACDIRDLVHWYSDGNLRPHISRVDSFEEGIEALELLSQRRVLGKLVISVRSGGDC